MQKLRPSSASPRGYIVPTLSLKRRVGIVRVARAHVVPHRRPVLVLRHAVAQKRAFLVRPLRGGRDALRLDQHHVRRIRQPTLIVADLRRAFPVPDIGEVGELALGAER